MFPHTFWADKCKGTNKCSATKRQPANRSQKLSFNNNYRRTTIYFFNLF